MHDTEHVQSDGIVRRLRSASHGGVLSEDFLENWFGIPREQFVDHLYVKQNEEAVRHLFLVACGLDSMIIGETPNFRSSEIGLFDRPKTRSDGNPVQHPV